MFLAELVLGGTYKLATSATITTYKSDKDYEIGCVTDK